jgi:Ca2+-binding EF-hand superfamily protein
MMTRLTQFQQRKLARMFDLYDANQDGYIDAADYARVGEGFATATGCAPGSADYEQLRAAYLGFWEQLRQAADADQDGKVTREEFVASYETLLAMRETIAGVSQAILQLTDRDGDGFIDPDELLQNVEEFFYGDDPNAPGNWLVGPL